jgi:hypothetical protein
LYTDTVVKNKHNKDISDFFLHTWTKNNQQQ